MNQIDFLTVGVLGVLGALTSRKLEFVGGAMWGYSEEGAIKNLQDVVRITVEELLNNA